MRARKLLIILITILLPSVAEAIDIYGRVRVKASGKTAPYARVTIKYGATSKKIYTDGNGVYRFLDRNTAAKCSISMSYQGKASNSYIIYLSRNRTRANFDLETRKESWRLIRR
jgi:hypothetical protein